MSTKKTNTEKVYNLLYSGKKVKLSTVAKRLYNSTDETSLSNARRIINHLKNDCDVRVKLVEKGTYQVK